MRPVEFLFKKSPVIDWVQNGKLERPVFIHKRG
jgi:hypothetical protein